MARLLSGKEVSDALDESTRMRVKKLRDRGTVPKLVIVRCGENPSDLSYERGALRRAESVDIETETIALPGDVSAGALCALLEKLGADAGVHGVLLFRPLPGALKAEEGRIVNALPPEKDVDSMTDLSQAGVYENRPIGFPPCTPEAVLKILDYYGIAIEGRKVAVIGRSLVVGRPLAMMLMARNATVAVCHTKTADVPEITRRADIVVTSRGAADSLTADFVREGQVVIDVSINYDPEKNNGRGGIRGDAAYEEVEPLVYAITPVPGGVGAVTSSVLMEHVVRAAELQCDAAFEG